MKGKQDNEARADTVRIFLVPYFGAVVPFLDIVTSPVFILGAVFALMRRVPA